MTDSLMPTTSCPIPYITDHQVLQYFKDKEQLEEERKSQWQKRVGLDFFTPSETRDAKDEKIELLETDAHKHT